MQTAKLTSAATIEDLAAALDLPPTPPRAERRIWTHIIEQFDAPPVRPTGETYPELIAAAEAQRARERGQIIMWSDFERAKAKDAEWRRLNALRPAAVEAAKLVQIAGSYADDAWLAAATEDEIRQRAQDIAALWHVPLARRAADEDRTPTPDELRCSCPIAQRRRLRRRAADVRQFWSAALQLSGGPPSHCLPRFCDGYTFSRWRERQERAAAFGNACRFVRGDGLEIPAADIMAASATANLNRLYVQMRGIEDLAEQAGLNSAMITLTLPPEYHPNPSQGCRSWTPEFAPAEADRELQRLWAKFRARLKRLRITTLGLRVVEAHTDGCPHVHAVLFATDEQLTEIDIALRAARPDEWDDLPTDDDETKGEKAEIRADRTRRGLKLRVATDFQRIDRTRARPSTYALAYILKAMNVNPRDAWKSKGLDDETRAAAKQAAKLADIEDDGIRDYDRHRALSAERRWRRYSILGAHGMQRIWQRLYRLKPDTEDEREYEPSALRRRTDFAAARVAYHQPYQCGCRTCRLEPLGGADSRDRTRIV